MRDILAGVPPASFQIYSDPDYDSLALLLSKNWKQDPLGRPSMQAFLFQLEVIEASRNLRNTTLRSSIQPEHRRDERSMLDILSSSIGYIYEGTSISSIHSAPELVDQNEAAAAAELARTLGDSST
jgi:hypothetical protein